MTDPEFAQPADCDPDPEMTVKVKTKTGQPYNLKAIQLSVDGDVIVGDDRYLYEYKKPVKGDEFYLESHSKWLVATNSHVNVRLVRRKK